MIYKYLRFSTDKQDEIQQENTIDKYLENIGIKADAVITDAGVSGGVSYDKRNLGELCNSLKPNDVIVVSELSRLTRGGIGDMTQARLSSAEKRNKMAQENSANKFLIAYINQYEAENGELNGTTPRAVFDVLADKLNALGQTTSTGLPYNTNRLRVAWARLKKLYV